MVDENLKVMFLKAKTDRKAIKSLAANLSLTPINIK